MPYDSGIVEHVSRNADFSPKTPTPASVAIPRVDDGQSHHVHVVLGRVR